jgi:hypothetical protein
MILNGTNRPSATQISRMIMRIEVRSRKIITAAQLHPFPLHCFNRRLAAGGERSTQSRSPLQLLSGLCERLTASTRCMQFAALAAAALLAAEAWGVSSALATRDASLYQGARANCRPRMHCRVWSPVRSIIRHPHWPDAYQVSRGQTTRCSSTAKTVISLKNV